MSNKQWVQHISGQGEKFFVEAQNERVWIINEPCFMRLPKSEYRLCDPPEVWKDVTEECKLSPLAGSELSHDGMRLFLPMGYRFRKVRIYPYQQPTEITKWAFIVEQQVTE